MQKKQEYLSAKTGCLIPIKDNRKKNKHFITGKFLLLLIGSLLILITGCSSVDNRIDEDQAAFDSWPADIQTKVRAGEVEIGFTREMTRMALGKPQRIITLTTDSGVAEAWVYEEKKSNVSVGLGMGTMQGRSAFGGGIGVGGDNWNEREILRITFDSTKVTAIEQRK